MPEPSPVNVSSVPQRSPFRYPGGKTWLVPRVRSWLAATRRPKTFVEPFAGGGIISLTVAFERLADQVVMVELDDDVAAAWQVIIHGNAQQLASRIVDFDLTPESVQQEFARRDSTPEDRAFATILKNRVNHGGIMAAGAGLLKYGENRRGITSRWYPDTLRRRILDIVTVRDRIQFIRGDGLETMRRYEGSNDAAFFIDPPYTAGGKRAGSRLYTHSALDHEELFRIAASVSGEFLMTYNDDPSLHLLAERHGFETQLVAMQNNHLAKMSELLIGRSLDWAR